MNHILYQLYRHRWLGWSLLRWSVVILFLYALLATLHVAPGGRVGGGLALVLMVLLAFLSLWARRRLFVRFKVEPRLLASAHPMPQGLQPGEKIPVHVTGRLSTGQREQVVVHAPGYLEQFRSGEKAISALVRPSRYLVLGALPPTYEGMWYAFIAPESVQSVDVGHLFVQGKRYQALKLLVRDAQRSQVLYLAFLDEQDLLRALRIFAAI